MAGDATIELTLSATPFEVTYWFVTPAVEINGKKERRAWGKHNLVLPPGSYDLSVSVPSSLWGDRCKRTVQVDLRPGQVLKLGYYVPFAWAQLRAKITVG